VTTAALGSWMHEDRGAGLDRFSFERIAAVVTVTGGYPRILKMTIATR
jgi:hypothetical protein